MTTVSSICYHYIAREDEFKRIWGHSFELFQKHVDFLQNEYAILNPQDVLKEKFEDGKNHMLLTFDDGLKEHVRVASYLGGLGLKGIFAIPSCILRGEPANPQVIHFGSAYYGVRKFYSFLVHEIRNNFSQHADVLIQEPDKEELMQLHKGIKNIFKRKLNHHVGRAVLLNIFNNQIKKDFPNFMELVYLNKDDIVNLVRSGHTIAVHSDTHPVMSDIEHDAAQMKNEVVRAKDDLSAVVGEEVNIFAYPFGEKTDIISNPMILTQAGYKQILTTYQASENFDQLHIGRYCSQSQDQIEDLTSRLWKYKIT